jgi:hypothetical protein
MKARLRIIVAALVGLLAAGAPARAQQAENTTATPPPGELVGPPQLKDFTLNGTVTRRPTEAPAQQAPAQQRQPARTAETKQPSPRSQPSSETSTAAPKPSQTAEVSAAPLPPEIDTSPGVEAIPGDQAALAPGQTPPPAEIPTPASTPTLAPSGAVPMLPWIVAALALAGAVGWFFFRQRPREHYGAAGSANLFDSLVEPKPEAAARAATKPVPAEPKAAAPVPTPQPRPQPGGIVSTRLRPTLELEVQLGRAIVDEKKAAVEFHLTVFNSGSIAARNVRVEASLFNAGPHQDAQIQHFFDQPLGQGDPIDAITPMQRISIDSAVILPRDQVQPIEFEGRQLFVPLIAFSALYSWPGGGPGQTSASYLVGKQTNGEKLAPLRLDLGPRLFRNLAVREHEVRLRK